MELTKGQTVVIERHRSGERQIRGTGTVSSIWKNGVIAVKDGKHTVGTFHPSGRERGSSGYYSGSRCIRPLAEGETAEQIAADLEAAADQARAGADKKQQEHDLKVENWWNDTGEDLWNSRVPVEGGLLGTDVFILRYTRHREERLAFITVEIEDRAFSGGKRYSIRSGGMVGEQWDGRKPSISTYSSSSASGKTLQEAVYSLCS